MDNGKLEMESAHLPEGWEIKKLESLFDVKSSKRVHKSDWKNEGIPFYRAREIVKLAENGFVENELFISEELFKEFTNDKGAPSKGDIVISAVGTLGKCYLVKDTDKFYFKDASVLWFDNVSNVNTKYIEYAFKSDLILKQVMHKSMGATVGTLTISRAKNILIPIPPLPEQKRIVAILDRAFEAIDKAKANAEQNLKNARELFESYLQGVFENKGDDWEEKTLDELCLKIQDGAHHSPKILYPEKKKGLFPYITSKNIRNNYMDLSKMQFVDEDFHLSIYPRCKPELGDVLLTKDGANTGNVTLNSLDEPFSLLSSVCLIKPDKTNLLPAFIKYYIQSPIGFKKITGEMTGAAIKRIILRAIKSATIPFPSVEEQKQIVQKVDALSGETKKLEVIYQQKLYDLEELKKSMLNKAFKGELTV